MSLGEGFEVAKDNTLSLHGVDLSDLCEKCGTPLFVFDELGIRENFQRFSPKTYAIRSKNIESS